MNNLLSLLFIIKNLCLLKFIFSFSIFTDLIKSEIFNIGPDENYISVNELYKKISNILKFNKEPIYYPDRTNEVKYSNCSADKARQLLNYKTKVSLKEGIQKTFDYIKKRGVKPFEYHINLEINNDLTPDTWKKKEI